MSIVASCHSDMEVAVIKRKLIVAGVSAFVLTPGVAWACGAGHGGTAGSQGPWGATGASGATGATYAPARQARFRPAHHAHARNSAGRG
jgi:hypothetical protein